MRYAFAVTAALLIAGALSCSYSPPGRCAADADCPLGLICAEGVCSGCSKNSECHIWQECSAGNTCVAMEGMCGIDEDCAAGQMCAEDHSCVACDNPDCEVALPGGNEPFLGGGGGSGEVWLFGTLAEGQASRDVLCDISAPNQVYAGFPTYAWTVRRRPDGQFVYLDDLARKLYVFTADTLKVASDGTITYPTDPKKNDSVIPTPACDNLGGVEWFEVQSGSGTIWYRCTQGGNALFHDSSPGVQPCGTLYAIAGDGGFLCPSGIQDPSGTLHDFTPPIQPWTIVDGRVKPAGGYWIFTKADSGPYSRWSVTADGAVTKDGDFAPMPTEIGRAYAHNTDRLGRLYFAASRKSDSIPDLYVRADFASSTVVYDEALKPKCKNHISYLVTAP